MDDQARALAQAMRRAIPGWVERCVETVAESAGRSLDARLRQRARSAGARAADEVGSQIEALLEADIDAQRTTPLSLLRDAVRFPTEVLREAGVPPAERDDFSVARFPDDLYGLTPAKLADVDPSLAEPGLAWGAAKAMAHRRRHGGG